jgi:hypothetical protein
MTHEQVAARTTKKRHLPPRKRRVHALAIGHHRARGRRTGRSPRPGSAWHEKCIECANAKLVPTCNNMKLGLAVFAATLAIGPPVSAQTMYRCVDQGKTIYSDKPCLNGDEVKQIAPNGNPTAEYLARVRGKERVEEQRAITAARAAKRDAELGKVVKCVNGVAATGCEQ